MSTSAELLQLEIVDDSQLATVAKQNHLAEPAAQPLLAAFAPFAKQARELVQQSEGITDPKKAREFRLKLREVRIEIEDARKRLKEDSLRTGKAVDGMANVLKFVIEPQEERLLSHEKAAEIAEANRKKAIAEDRAAQLRAVAFNVEVPSLAEMPDAAFAELLANAKELYAAKLERERKAAEEAAARAKAEAEERERVRAENERLRREAAEREAAQKAELEKIAREREVAEAARKAELLAAQQKAAQERAEAEKKAAAERAAVEAERRAERERLEAIAKAEREAREKAEREAAASRKAEQDRIAAELRAKQAAAMAPDKEKIKAAALALRTMDLPGVTSNEAAKIMGEFRNRLVALAEWLEQKGGAL